MSKIQNYDDLLAEKESLERKLAVQKEIIRQDINALKEELRPATAILKFLGKVTTKDRSNSLLNLGVDVVGDLVLKNFVLAKSGWLTRLILPYFAKNLSSNLLAGKNGNGNILQQLISKFSRKAA